MRFIIAILVVCTTGAMASDLYPPLKEMTPKQAFLFRTVPLEKIDTNKGLEKLTGFPTGKGNAADHYSRLEALFIKDRVTPGKYQIKKRSEGVREILRAVSIKDCRLSPKYYPYMVSGSTKQPDIVIFLAYAQALFELAKELEDKCDYKGAGAVYRSVLIYGWHLTQEPPSLITLILGVRIKAKASREYAAFLQRKLDITRSNLAQSYSDYLEQEQKKILTKLNLYLGNMLGFNSLYSAMKIATEDPQLIWRQEAVMRLGILRHGSVGSAGNIVATDQKLQKKASDALLQVIQTTKSPSLKQLAAWSVKQLTPASFMPEVKKK